MATTPFLKARPAVSEPGRPLGNLKRDTAGVFTLKVAFSGLSLLLNIVLTRMLGSFDYGAYTYAFAWVTLLGIPAILGMDQLLVREIATYTADSAWGKLRGILRQANRAVFVASLAISLVALLFTLYYGTESTMTRTFLIALPTLPFICLTRVRQAALQGLGRVVMSNITEALIQPLLMILLIAAGWLFIGRLNAPSTMAIKVLANGACFLIGAWILARHLPEAAKHAAPAPVKLPFKRSVLPLVFLASINVIYGQGDILILGAIKGARAVGHYGVADRSAMLINFLLAAVNTSFSPMISSLYASRDLSQLQRAFAKVTQTTFLLTLPLGLGLILFGHWWLLLLYGPDFVAARWALAILCGGQLICAAAGPVGTVLIMTGHEKDAASAILASAAANCILCAALIPRWGLEGAAIAAAVASAVWSLLLMNSVRRRLGIRPALVGIFTAGK